MLVTVQLLANALEIGAPTVANDGILAFEFDAGDHRRIAAKRERWIEAKCLLEYAANVLGLRVGKRRRGEDLDWTPSRGGGEVLPYLGRHCAHFAANLIDECVENILLRKMAEQTLRDIEGELAGAVDDCLFRCRPVPRERGLHFAAELGDLFGGLREQVLLLDLRRLARCCDQPVPVVGDRRARRVGVGTLRDSRLAGLRCVGQQLVRLVLALGDDRHNRPEEEPGEKPDQNEDVDGLQRQRPPVDAHGLNE